MFGLLKDKLSGFISKFSKKVEEGVEKETKAHPRQEGKPEAFAERKIEKPAEAVVEPAAAEEEERIVEHEPGAPKAAAKERAKEKKAAKKERRAEERHKRAEKKAAEPLRSIDAEESEEPELPEEAPVEIPPVAETAPAGPEEEIELRLKEPLPRLAGKAETQPAPEKAAPAPKKGLFASLFGKKEAKKEEKREVLREALKVQVPPIRQEPQGILGRITTTVIDGKDVEKLLWEFQLGLLENDVAYDTAQKICGDLKANLVGRQIRRGQVDKAVKDAILYSIRDVLKEGFDLMDRIKKSPKPFKIIFVGINGTGKTTTIAKIAHLCKRNGLEPVLAAADTFRAASIEQLEHHARVLDVKIIKQGYGADSTAVAYDAVEHAKATGKDVVLIDTAGRLHSNANLMDELGKMIRVIKPDLVIFVGDAMTGNDAAEQAKQFAALRVDAAILTKADADAKGGACISISHSIQRPILYLGTGQKYEDLTPFSPEWFIEKVVS